jgi:Fur family iron response transcriptional regulator
MDRIELKNLRAHCLSPGEVENRLKQAGVQPTAQRIAICRYVLCQADHPTADDVKHWADRNFPKLSLATVYNTLGILVKAGLLRELRLPHSDKVIYDNNVAEHHHFLDEGDGQLYDVHAEQVSVESRLPKGFELRNTEVLFRGKIRKTS